MSPAAINPLVQFGVELGALVLSPILTAAIIKSHDRAKARVEQPAENAKAVAEVRDTLAAFVAAYNASSDRNKRFQEALFQSSEQSFNALEAQTKGIRFLAESVCNGNKPKALAACDEADECCKQGRAVKETVLMKSTFG